MKNFFAIDGIEFIAVVLGITISLWIEDGKNRRSGLKEIIELINSEN